MLALKTIEELSKEVSVVKFIDELLLASEQIAILTSKIEDSKLKNYIYMPLLQQREAMESLKIEGTQTTISDLISDNVLPIDNEPIEEARNYSVALRFGCDSVRFGFDEKLIKEIHKRLISKKVHINKDVALGEYKKKQNYIKRGNVIVYTPPTPSETELYMKELLEYLTNSHDNELIKVALFHSQFESIHPFDDGNGRVGRILIPIYLLYKEKINAPLFYISEAFNEDKIRYYKMLTVSREGDINEWIKYFLEKSILQAKKHIKFINKINLLYEYVLNEVSKLVNTSLVNKIVDILFEYPAITSKKLSEKLGVSTAQAIRYLNLLNEDGILVSNDAKRNKAYFFYELIDLINQ